MFSRVFDAKRLNENRAPIGGLGLQGWIKPDHATLYQLVIRLRLVVHYRWQGSCIAWLPSAVWAQAVNSAEHFHTSMGCQRMGCHLMFCKPALPGYAACGCKPAARPVRSCTWRIQQIPVKIYKDHRQRDEQYQGYCQTTAIKIASLCQNLSMGRTR